MTGDFWHDENQWCFKFCSQTTARYLTGNWRAEKTGGAVWRREAGPGACPVASQGLPPFPHLYDTDYAPPAVHNAKHHPSPAHYTRRALPLHDAPVPCWPRPVFLQVQHAKRCCCRASQALTAPLFSETLSPLISRACTARCPVLAFPALSGNNWNIQIAVPKTAIQLYLKGRIQIAVLNIWGMIGKNMAGEKRIWKRGKALQQVHNACIWTAPAGLSVFWPYSHCSYFLKHRDNLNFAPNFIQVSTGIQSFIRQRGTRGAVQVLASP